MYKDVIGSVKQYFESLGFKFVKSRREFVKKFNLGEFRYGIESQRAGTRILHDYSIRIDIIEAITDQFYQREKDLYFTTVHVNLENALVSKGETYCDLDTPERLKSGIEKTNEYFERYALPYFNKYSTIEAIDKLINEENPIGTPAINSFLNHTETVSSIVRGLVAAKLAKRKNFEEIANHYMQFLKTYGDGKYILRLENLLQYLNELDIEYFEKKFKLNLI